MVYFVKSIQYFVKQLIIKLQKPIQHNPKQPILLYCFILF